MNNSRWGILYCPKSGYSNKQKRWQKIAAVLKERGVDYDMVQSETHDSVARLMSMLIRNGYQTIIIVGGDADLNDAVNCLMREEKTVRQQIALGVIPNGAVNDFARFWGFDEHNDAQTIEWLIAHRERKVDLGCICYNDKDGRAQHRYFLNSLNIGMTADVMNLRTQARHILGSQRLALLISGVLMLFHPHDYKMKFIIDYETINRSIMTVCVGNALGYGQTPNAVPYSGQLDISVVHTAPVKQLFEAMWLLLTGRFLNHRSVHPYRVRKLSADTGKARVSMDGRPMEKPQGEYHIHVEPEVINFLIPV